jgi:thymidylate kinase
VHDARQPAHPAKLERRATAARPYLVEVAGVAGAGKSTLVHLICEREADCHRADFIHARTLEHLGYMAHSLPRSAPILAGNLRGRPRLDWAGFKLIVYATEWHRFLNRKPEYRHGVTLLDQGPIYALVRLKAKGARVTTGARFERWWDETLELWAGELGALVWLDAPDRILMDRINGRDQWHGTKGERDDVGQRFIARYRALFEEVLHRIEIRGGPQILRFDTSRMSSERLAAEIRPFLAGRSEPPRQATDGG